MRAPYVDRSPRFQLTIKVRAASFDSEKVIKLLEKGNYAALRKIGLDLKEQAKRSVGQAAPARTKAGNKAAGAKAVVTYKQGLYRDMTIVSGGKPRPPGSPRTQRVVPRGGRWPDGMHPQGLSRVATVRR